MFSADFPTWLRATHLINFILMGILLRSGWEMIASMPRLWWRNDCKPGTEWLRFTRRKLPKEEGVYTSLMDELSVSPMLTLPGRKNIGLARHWHGLGVMLWVLNGLVYVGLLFGTGLWRRIIPTSWDIVPKAWESFKIYLGFGIPSIEHFQPYDALQMIAYTAVIFLVAPAMILTGLAMSPAIRGKFPWYVKAFGGHQGARSLHFLAMVAMCLFIVIHVGLVFIAHPEHNLIHMAFGKEYDPALVAQAYTIVIATIVAVIGFWIALSYLSLLDRAKTHHFLEVVTEPARKLFLNWMKPNGVMTSLSDRDLSEFHWTNGLPPTEDESAEWVTARDNAWAGYTVSIADETTGKEVVLTLDELKALPKTEYYATHTCMQGWSATSKWAGVKLSDVLSVLGPRPAEARYVKVSSYGLAQEMYDHRPREPFYAVLANDTIDEEGTVLTYERNGHDLEEHLGAPVRLRVESNHGYKMVKWVSRIEWIRDYKDHGDGRGGTREDSALQVFNGRI